MLSTTKIKVNLAFSNFFRQVPAFLNVTDIAGLVKGASEGQGLGNAFLSHIRVSNTNTSDVSIIR